MAHYYCCATPGQRAASAWNPNEDPDGHNIPQGAVSEVQPVMADESSADANLLRPRPRRPFELDSKSTESSTPNTPPTPSGEATDSSKPLRPEDEKDSLTSKTRSVLNLTSSTLFGIYSPSSTGGDESTTTPSTPLWLAGGQTPMPRSSVDDQRPPVIGAYERPALRRAPSSQHHHSLRNIIMPMGLRTILLFFIGVAYGVLISQLHDTPHVAPVQIDGIKHWSWGYLMGWGGVGVALGGLLPWVDIFWGDMQGKDKDVFASHERTDSKTSNSSDEDEKPGSRGRSGFSGLGADWNPVVRSIGAFIGIAFAIRRLPWQSTLQVSLTLALVNPVLWYLVDRSKPGFILSTLVGITGTVIAFGVNPEIVPSPATSSPMAGMAKVSQDGILLSDSLITNESIGVMTWIASVLFCSSVCFGNIGRRLALARRPSVP